MNTNMTTDTIPSLASPAVKIQRLQDALTAHVRFQAMWARGATKTELQAARDEAMKLTQLALWK